MNYFLEDRPLLLIYDFSGQMKVSFCRRLLFGLCATTMVITLVVVRDARYCDVEELNKAVHTPSGKLIPYYTGASTVKSFGELSGYKCRYDLNDTVQCPDVRLKGESMNRQSLLVIARLHAIFDVICRRHGIRYFVFAGSLLGSQRDGKLIPWDYDSDIGIMMDDFLELLKHIRRELPADIYFEDGVDNPTFKKFCEARLRDRNSCYGHCLRTGCDRHDGIQVDIFAFRKVNDDPTKITSNYYHKLLKYNDIFPTTEVLLEGLRLQGPRNHTALNTYMYGADHLTLPEKSQNQCQKNGYTAIPWYSCETLQAMPDKERDNILKVSMGHRNWFYWYFG